MGNRMVGWKALKLGRKLILLFLVLGLAPVAVVGLITDRSVEATLTAQAGRGLEEVAFSAADKLDRNLFERYGDVQAFALSDPARSMDPTRLSHWMDTMVGAYSPIYKLMIVADPKGRIVAVNGVD